MKKAAKENCRSDYTLNDENVSKNKKEYLYLNLFICVSSVLVSNIGFSNLISYLYPVFGVLGIVQIFYICKFVGADDSVRPKREKNV